MNQRLTDWGIEETVHHDKAVIGFNHRLHQLEAFSPPEIERILDRCPRDRLQAFTMGDDIRRNSDWKPVNVGHATGREILDAVAKGRLWVKALRLDLLDEKYEFILKRLYEEIAEQTKGSAPLWLRPLLLVSSPKAFVYYHADAHPTMLWQISGTKRIRIYPAQDRTFVDPALMETIYVGRADEEVPYVPSFDKGASVHDLGAGRALSWPLNAPHRVTNLRSTNVSLSVAYGTHRGERCSELYQANYYLRHYFGVRKPATYERGFASLMKRAGLRISRRIRVIPPSGVPRVYMTDLKLDPSSKDGLRRLPNPARTAF